MTFSPGDVLTIFGIAASVGGGAVYTGVKLALRSIDRIRTNDLHHLEEKIDHVAETVTRIDRRLDTHLEDHARDALAKRRRG